jgi:hypothetical protein
MQKPLTRSQIVRRIAHLNKLRTFAAKKRRPARVRHYQRLIDALYGMPGAED